MRNRFKGLDLIECLKNYGQQFVTLYRRQESRPFPRKRNAKKQMAVWGGLTNSCEKKGSKKQRTKGKIYPFEGRVPKNTKERLESLPQNQIWRDTCTPMFIAALFIIARTWKQPRCPSAEEWIRKLWYICTMEYYPAIKKNSFESILMRWMKLEPLIQSEVSQKDKDQYSILTHIYGI